MARIDRERLAAYDREISQVVEQAASDLGPELLELVALFRAAGTEEERAPWRSALAEAYWAAVADGQEVCHALADELWAEAALLEGIESKAAAVHAAIRREEADRRIRSVMQCLFERGWDDGRILGSLQATARSSVEAAPNRAMEDNISRAARAQPSLRYARVPASAEACGFCFMISSLGFAYGAEGKSPDHPNHPNCRCRVVPGFEGQTEVEGYDFAAMRDRLRRCEETLALPAGVVGEERRNLIAAECETRDSRWLWFGEEPRVGYDPEWVEYENETAGILGRHGFVVDPIPRSMERRRPDFALNGVEWEMKHPSHPGYMPVWNQFKKAVCGKSLHVRNPQSDKLVISNVRSGEDVDAIVGHVLDVANDEKDAFPEIKEVLVVSEKGIRRVKR